MLRNGLFGFSMCGKGLGQRFGLLEKEDGFSVVVACQGFEAWRRGRLREVRRGGCAEIGLGRWQGLSVL